MPDDVIRGTIVNYRQGRHTIHQRHLLLKFPNIESDKAAMKLMGKKVYWESPAGKIMTGVVCATHGRQGVVRANFKQGGVPGQALGQQIALKM